MIGKRSWSRLICYMVLILLLYVYEAKASATYDNATRDDWNNETSPEYETTTTALSEACGGNIVSNEGNISSPNFPNYYGAHENCLWKITVDPGYVVEFKFTFIEVEALSNCAYDHVWIKDGHDPQSTSLGMFCGSSIPPTIVSSGNKMRVRFKADGSDHYRGFSAEFKKGRCGGNIVSDERTFSSPNFPENYLPNSDCMWRITVREGYTAALNFSVFEVQGGDQCTYDYVKVFDGHELSSPILGTFCGNDVPDVTESTGNKIAIVFKSDATDQRKGFSAAVKKGVCEKDIVSDQGNISSPNYPNAYAGNDNCTWRITVEEGRKIILRFTFLKVEDHTECNYDYVKILDGHESSSPVLAKVCGSRIPYDIASSSNKLSIEFKSDGSAHFTGFAAEFRKDICGRNMVSDEGNISSPNYPNNYSRDENCAWKITVQEGYKIFLRFTDFQLEDQGECEFDYVTVLDGHESTSPILGILCGIGIPNDIISSSNKMKIRFKSDSSVHLRGFAAEFRKTLSEAVVSTNQITMTTTEGIGTASGTATENSSLVEETTEPVNQDNHLVYTYIAGALATIAAIAVIIVLTALVRSRRKQTNDETVEFHCDNEELIKWKGNDFNAIE